LLPVRIRSQAQELKTGVEFLAESPNTTIPNTVSPGYGEITQRCFDSILHYLQYEIEDELKLNQNSRFLDIGSGFGKCIVHAKLRTECKASMGIEYVPKRNQIANELLNKTRTVFPQLAMQLRNCKLIQGDICSSKNQTVLLRQTHIYLFNVLFNDLSLQKIFPLIDRIGHCKVVICNSKPSYLAQCGVTWKLLKKFKSATTGNQTFTCYSYNTGRNTTAQSVPL
jgi:hypothetical protein